MTDSRSNDSGGDYDIRLQFPNGRSDTVQVCGTTTVEELYRHYVADEVPQGLTGQLIYLGRPLVPPASTMSDHFVTRDMVVQVFMRRPMQTASADQEAREEVHDNAGFLHSLSALCGFGLVCSWIYFLLGEQSSLELERGSDSSTDVLALICLVLLTVVFLLFGGLGRFLSR